MSRRHTTQKHSLAALARELLEKAAGGGTGRTAQTVVGGHEKVLRQTAIAMVRGAELREHANPGEATVYVLRGRVALKAGGQTWEGQGRRPAHRPRHAAQPPRAAGLRGPAHRRQASLTSASLLTPRTLSCAQF